MKKGIYQTMAWTGIKKNKKLYIPYIFTCMGAVMMCYIVSFLSTSPTFSTIPGGSTVQSFLEMGFGVMSIFSVIFLFYTNSFLIRRRKKEFGLYNILGLGKKHLAIVLFLETLLIAVGSIVAGLFWGILLSKLAELCLIRILGAAANFAITVQLESMLRTTTLFLGIFVLIFLNTLRQVQLANPIQLLRSENTGEKPPKANWLMALLGAGILAGAYYIAVTIKDPVSAIFSFFVAVVMVIIATYLLFVSGSVTLCRMLQKNKKYYYKTNHFVSVSSMVYRMKRNGAGLASICILCTMVLVMVSSTMCLYIGAEDSLRNRYPRNISLDAVVSDLSLLQGEQPERVKQTIGEIVATNGTTQENILSYRTAVFGGIVEENRLLFDLEAFQNEGGSMSDIWQIFVVPIEDYNRLMGKQETVAQDEVIIYTTKEMTYTESTLQIGESEPLKVKKLAESFVDNGVDSMQIFPTMYLFVSDIAPIIQPIQMYSEQCGEALMSLHWYYGFDLACNDQTQIQIQQQLVERRQEMGLDEADRYFDISLEGVASERADFYGIYAGLFFLGILLGIVFVFAAVLIIYYKQISEGYEDCARFSIMQKVGMTKREIKKSINSQVITVFFLPLVTAGVHLTFAFPPIRKLLLILGLENVSLLVITTIGCYAVFALFYLIVYRLTSRSYYSIVSGMRGDLE